MNKTTMLDLIPIGKENSIKRKSLAKLCRLDDNTMRAEISKTRKVNRADHAILNDQDGVGYYQPIFPDDYDKVVGFIKQEESRAKSIIESLASAKAFLRAVEKSGGCK